MAPRYGGSVTGFGDARWTGRFPEAHKIVAALPADNWVRLTVEATATARLGDRAASDRALAELVRLHGTGSQYQIAEVHAQRGETEAAFTALDRAWNLADTGLTRLKTDPLLAPLHADPRFAALVRKIGFP